MTITMRKATAADSEKLFSLITELAIHQGHLQDVKTKRSLSMTLRQH